MAHNLLALGTDRQREYKHETNSHRICGACGRTLVGASVSRRKINHLELGRKLERPDRADHRQEIQSRDTGAEVEFVTGGTIDRLNKAKLAKGNPESDITFTTSHVGWLYATDGLYETLDLDKIPNAKSLVPQAKISPYHIGSWAYVYTIGYRPDMVPAGMTV